MEKLRKLLPSSFGLKIFGMTIGLLLFLSPPSFATDSLRVRVNRILDKAEEVRIVLHRIAVRANNENAPGWSKVVEMGNNAGERLQRMREWAVDFTDRFEHNTMPFATKMKTPEQRPRILGRLATFNPVESVFPNFPPEFPKLTNFAGKFLDLVERPLDDVLQAATNLDDSMSTALSAARMKLSSRTGPTGSDSLPDATFNYEPLIREWLGAFGVQIAAKELAELITRVTEMVDAAGDQTFVIVGEGGNVKGAVGWPTAIVRLLTGMAKELVAHVDNDITSGFVKGSYNRLEYVHNQIVTLDDKVDVLDGKVDVLDGKVNVLTSEFRDYRTLSIRTRIEINLAGHGDHPHPIAIFMLPAQFGGYLELARDIVQSTINNMIAAGENVHQAMVWLTRGNNEFSAGRYKKAYDNYGKSYAEATK
jgi:hypothetical protein